MLLKAIFRKIYTSKKNFFFLLFQNKIEQRSCCSRLFLEKVARVSKTILFQNKIEQGFCCSRLFLEKVYRFLSEYEYEYLVCNCAICKFVCRVSVRERSRGMCEYCCKSWCLVSLIQVFSNTNASSKTRGLNRMS